MFLSLWTLSRPAAVSPVTTIKTSAATQECAIAHSTAPCQALVLLPCTLYSAVSCFASVQGCMCMCRQACPHALHLAYVSNMDSSSRVLSLSQEDDEIYVRQDVVSRRVCADPPGRILSYKGLTPEGT
eukprot:362632-Chlamydomonas_euryale.AAC.4